MTPPDHQPAPLPPAARWAAVALLGGVGLVGVLRGTLGPAPMTIDPGPASLAGTTPDRPAPASPTVASPDAGNPAAGNPVPVTSPVTSPATGSVARLININTATAAELQLIKGIGPVTAGRIIEFRQANGPFTTLDDLDDVSGIGPKTIAKLVPYATAE